MTDRENSPAFQQLSRAARKVFAAIEAAIGNRSSASVSYTDFGLDHRVALKEIAPAVRLLDHLGLIEVEQGKRLINHFRLSNRWRSIDEVGAARLSELAKELKPRRTFEKRREANPVNAPRPKPMTVARPRIRRRQVPSLPQMPWHSDGR